MGQAHFTKSHGKVTIKDRTSPTKLDYVNVALEVGDFKAAGLTQGNREVVQVTARNVHQGLEFGAPKVLSLSWTTNLKRETLHHASSERPMDTALKSGAFGSGTTANPATEVWTVDVLYELTDGTTSTSMLFEDCRLTVDVTEGEVITLSFSAECYGGFTVDPS